MDISTPSANLLICVMCYINLNSIWDFHSTLSHSCHPVIVTKVHWVVLSASITTCFLHVIDQTTPIGRWCSFKILVSMKHNKEIPILCTNKSVSLCCNEEICHWRDKVFHPHLRSCHRLWRRQREKREKRKRGEKKNCHIVSLAHFKETSHQFGCSLGKTMCKVLQSLSG